MMDRSNKTGLGCRFTLKSIKPGNKYHLLHYKIWGYLLLPVGQLKIPRDVKPKVDVPIEKIALCGSNHRPRCQAKAIGKNQLKHMSSRFYIEPHPHCIKIWRSGMCICPVEILTRNGQTAG